MDLIGMPRELLNEIFIQLRDDALPDLLPAALVSRHFYTITMPLIYQSITIHISEWTYHQGHQKYVRRPPSALVTRLSTGSTVRALVRNVHVFGRNGAHPDTLELLQSWLPHLSCLVSFSWDVDGSFPTALLECLGRHWPSSALHMRTIMPNCNIKKEWKILKVAPNMLRSLQVNMPNSGERSGNKEDFKAKERLFWVLSNCTGLRSLTTYYTRDFVCSHNQYRLGLLEPSGSWHDVKLKSPMPQLLELSIADKTIEVNEILALVAKGGLTKLKKITLWDHQLLHSFLGREQSLRSINLIDARPGYESALAKICSHTMNLTELRIRTEDSRLPFSVLEICGHSLTTLAVHPHKDRGDYQSGMQDISLEFLRAIQRLCPKLTDLASNLRWPPDSPDHLSVIGQFSRLKHMTLHIIEPRPNDKQNTSLAAVEQTFRHVIEHSDTKQNLKTLTLKEGRQYSDWNNPWGILWGRTTQSPGRVFRATRTTHGGEKEPKFRTRQIWGPSETRLERHTRQDEWVRATQETTDYLDAMPPAVLSRMIEDNRAQVLGSSSSTNDYSYEIQTGGWDPKLAEYEERRKESSGILPLLEWQLRKRKEHGWKLWDMPLMNVDAGSEGFLYDRMAETSAEG